MNVLWWVILVIFVICVGCLLIFKNDILSLLGLPVENPTFQMWFSLLFIPVVLAIAAGIGYLIKILK